MDDENRVKNSKTITIGTLSLSLILTGAATGIMYAVDLNRARHERECTERVDRVVGNYLPRSVQFRDVNNDGRDDLVIRKEFGGYIFLKQIDGTYSGLNRFSYDSELKNYKSR